MRKSDFLTGFILGGLIGAGMALLYTPDSGQNMRGQASGFFKDFGREVKLAAAERRSQLEGELESLRRPQKPDEGI